MDWDAFHALSDEDIAAGVDKDADTFLPSEDELRAAAGERVTRDNSLSLDTAEADIQRAAALLAEVRQREHLYEQPARLLGMMDEMIELMNRCIAIALEARDDAPQAMDDSPTQGQRTSSSSSG